MDSRHASLGRRTLEEIRQKRAAERLSKTSSGPDLSQIPPIDNGGMRKSESANRLSESDVSTLVSQIRDLDRKNAELEEENKNLASMLETNRVEYQSDSPHWSGRRRTSSSYQSERNRSWVLGFLEEEEKTWFLRL
ncbi:uncharacterized protein LOC133711268 [Rosa rugosa]|uniref:uncharacterized protein LOC133711268 n=1 Tax=Rosa rugosa TaxID=74645 RepID=UPI002B415CAE|nr:uncharacterized protein LOC133711268 [Rosa rugosa]